MPVERHTFKERRYDCPACGATVRKLAWDYDAPPFCQCLAEMHEHDERPNPATFVIGDEIDLVIRHGLCNEDGTPRRWRSREELRREERRRGLCVLGETPK